MRMTWLFIFALTMAVSVEAQVPDGSDINQAIPIYFGQTINDIVDSQTKPIQVYSITLAKGQSFSALAKLDNTSTIICLLCARRLYLIFTET